MSVLSEFPLPDMAFIAPELITTPAVIALWYNTSTRNGWAVAGVGISLCHILRYGLNIFNPLNNYLAGSEREAASHLYWVVYPIMLLISLAAGYIIDIVFDIKPVICISNVVFNFLENLVDPPIHQKPVAEEASPEELDVVMLYDAAHDETADDYHRFVGIKTGFLPIIVGMLAYIVAVIVPCIVFRWTFYTVITKWGAMVLSIGLKIVAYIVHCLYNIWWTPLATFGPTEYNIKKRQEDGEALPSDPITNRIIYKDTRNKVIRQSVVMGLVDVLGFFLLTGIITFPSGGPDADWVWIFGLCYNILIIGTCLVYLFYRWWVTKPDTESNSNNNNRPYPNNNNNNYYNDKNGSDMYSNYNPGGVGSNAYSTMKMRRLAARNNKRS